MCFPVVSSARPVYCQLVGYARSAACSSGLRALTGLDACVRVAGSHPRSNRMAATAASPALSLAPSSDDGCDAVVLLAASPSPTPASSAQSGTSGATSDGLRSLASSAQLETCKREWTSLRRSRAGRRALLVIAFSCLVYLVHHAGMPAQASPRARRDRPRVRDLADWRGVYASRHPGIARVSPGHSETFLEYLDAHFPPSSGQTPPPHIWITLAETEYVRTGVANLDLFVRQINSERSEVWRDRTRDAPCRPLPRRRMPLRVWTEADIRLRRI